MKLDFRSGVVTFFGSRSRKKSTPRNPSKKEEKENIIFPQDGKKSFRLVLERKVHLISEIGRQQTHLYKLEARQ